MGKKLLAAVVGENSETARAVTNVIKYFLFFLKLKDFYTGKKAFTGLFLTHNTN